MQLALLLLYAAGLTLFGVWIGRRVRGSSDFFVGGRSFGPMLLMSSMLAANIGAGATVNVAGLAYREGLNAWWWSGSAGKIPRYAWEDKRYVREDATRERRSAAGCQRTRASDTRPRASNRTPSRSSRRRCSRSAPGTALRLQEPAAFTTRCHGTVVPAERACSAYPTCRACPDNPASSAT